MLSGIWPRGSNSAPGSGNTGITSRRSPGPRYSALIGIGVPLLMHESLGYARTLIAKPAPTFAEYALRKKDRRQPLSPLNGGLIGRAPGLEELHQLLSRAVLIPFAVAFDDFEQLLGRLT